MHIKTNAISMAFLIQPVLRKFSAHGTTGWWHAGGVRRAGAYADDIKIRVADACGDSNLSFFF
jgi:hypothetical protein